MALTLDQLVFGYEDGHRLLSQSTDIPRRASSALLALTDTPVRHGRALSAGPILGTGLYALAATWPAPEVPRPGAVWAHVLLVPQDRLAEVRPGDLARLLRRPSHAELRQFSQPIDVGQGPPVRQDDFNGTALFDALFECARATYASRARVARVESPEDAEQAILRIWNAQWPGLRSRFSFRTRFDVRAAPEDCDLVIGLSTTAVTSRPTSDDGWLHQLARELCGAPADLLSFLSRYGPEEPPRPASLRALARTWTLIREQSVEAVRERLEQRYPQREQATELKAQLFGEGTGLWQVADRQRLVALLASSVDAWDARRLGLASRVRTQVSAGDWRPLIAHTASDLPEPVHVEFVRGLAAAATPDLIHYMAAARPSLAAEVLAQSDVARIADTWRRLSCQDARSLLEASGRAGDPSVVAAVLDAGWLRVAVRSTPRSALDTAVGEIPDSTLERLWADSAQDELAEAIGRLGPVNVLRLASLAVDVPPDDLRSALSRRRREPDDRWLRSAVHALTKDPDALEIVFGPLHHAITDDRLPRASWQVLERVLPPDGDPARRLRKYLLRRIRDERWSKPQIVRALDGAGPYSREILRDVEDDDVLTKLFKGFRQRLGL